MGGGLDTTDQRVPVRLLPELGGTMKFKISTMILIVAVVALSLSNFLRFRKQQSLVKAASNGNATYCIALSNLNLANEHANYGGVNWQKKVIRGIVDQYRARQDIELLVYTGELEGFRTNKLFSDSMAYLKCKDADEFLLILATNYGHTYTDLQDPGSKAHQEFRAYLNAGFSE